MGPQHGSSCMSPFWHLVFSNFFPYFWKFFDTRAYNSISKNFSQIWPQRQQCQESTYSNYYILIPATSFLFNIKLSITCGDAQFALCNLIHKSAAFSVWTPSILNINNVYYSPTNTQVISLKDIIKVYIKIAPTCFGAVTPSSGSSIIRAC